MSLGVGLFGLWATSFWRVHRAGDLRVRAASGVVNAAGPNFWAATILSGQVTHGVRYFVPFYVFAIGWNLLSSPQAPWPSWARSTKTLGSALAALACVWGVELWMLRSAVSSRATSLLALRSGGLDRLAGRRGIAYDVGQIGYFTGADICDVRGLINGRRMALLGGRARLDACWGRGPDFAFMSEVQARDFPGLLAWPLCGQYALDNLAKSFVVQLRVRPEIGCSLGEPR